MTINKPIIGVAAAVVVIAAGTWYYLQSRHASSQRVPVTAQRPVPEAEPDRKSVV